MKMNRFIKGRKSAVAKRLFSALFIFWVTITINFLLPRLMPGDGLTLLYADAESMGITLSQTQAEQLMQFYGFDQPLWKQYISSLTGIFTGEWGMSIIYKKPVLNVIQSGLLWTVGVVAASTAISAFLGTLLGCFSAYRQQSPVDVGLYTFMTAFSEIPSFLIGFLLLYFVAGKAQLLPLSGGQRPFAEYTSFADAVGDISLHAILPVTTLVLTSLSDYYITARQSMITVLRKDYIGTARTKGMPHRRILFFHALPNAIPPIVARLCMSFSRILGGAVVIESVFAYPGLGMLLRDAALARDYPMLQGLYVIISGLVIVMNMLSDVIYAKIDRRLQ